MVGSTKQGFQTLRAALASALSVAACGDSAPDLSGAWVDSGAVEAGALPGVSPEAGVSGDIVFRADVTPVRGVEQALPNTFIPPFPSCRPLEAGDSLPDGQTQICTQVAISACTAPGLYYPSYASCEVVRRQRPYWPAPPAASPDPTDARLQDPAYTAELAWVTEQVAASGCTCCHDARVAPGGMASQWDIAAQGVWLDTLSDTGLALFTGLADSSVLGAYPAADNFGFSRDVTGIPSTDPARMQAFMSAELERRGLTQEWARAVPPFGGPIYQNSIAPSLPCEAGQGVAPDGKVHFTSNKARYVYVLEAGAANPGVPPNLDLPQGVVWRLDVLASAEPLTSPVTYGTTPIGSFQSVPESSAAPALTPGRAYKLYVMQDMGLPITNCTFTFGSALPAPVDAGMGGVDGGVVQPDAGGDGGGTGGDPQAGVCDLAGGDARGFGAPCDDTVNHSDCPCEADYCAKSPFDARGYCSVVDCLANSSVCPSGWSCTDLAFVNLPSVCTRP